MAKIIQGTAGNDRLSGSDRSYALGFQEYPNEGAFAALKKDGSVFAWGSELYGGDITPVKNQLKSGVVEIFSSGLAFAALKNNGSVVTWGASGKDATFPNDGGGDSSAVASQISSGVKRVYSTRWAFAALKLDGSVVTWGSASGGGNSSKVKDQLKSDVVEIFSNEYAFAAVKADGSVVTWGAAGIFDSGGDGSAVASKLSSGVKRVFSTSNAFAALKTDGSVVTWGDDYRGGDSSDVQEKLKSGVAEIFSNGDAFAALKSDGSIVFWGPAEYYTQWDHSRKKLNSISEIQGLDSGVVKVLSANDAFALLKADGSVISLGSGHASEMSEEDQKNLKSGVVDIVSSEYGFAALKKDGSVVSFGMSGWNIPDAIAEKLKSGVKKLISSGSWFAAYKENGEAVFWGDSATIHASGNIPNEIKTNLDDGVIKIFQNGPGYAAIKEDGSVIVWGNELYNIKPNTLELQRDVIDIADPATLLQPEQGPFLIKGEAGNDTLQGSSHADTLDGGMGLDSMAGGGGNDVYIVDNLGDVLIESPNSGSDIVLSSLSYILTENFENLRLTGSAAINATGNALANQITGNAAGNRISAGAGNDTLNGGTGLDTVKGEVGNDLLQIDWTSLAGVAITRTVRKDGTGTAASFSGSYVAKNASGAVISSITFDTIESLTLNGQAVDLEKAVAAPGVTIRRTSTATATTEQGGLVQYSVVLDKAPFENVTVNFASSDTTEGKVKTPSITFTPQNWSTPRMLAIQGVDDYLDDSNVAYSVAGKVVTSDLTYNRVVVPAITLLNNDDGQDNDRIIYGTDETDYLSGANGNDRIYGKGRQDQLKGGVGEDRLYGDQDDDRLFGELGNDKLYGGYDDDSLDGGQGSDSLYGEQGLDTLLGGEGNDYLDGGIESDSMSGGSGNDTYLVDSAGDKINDMGVSTDVDVVQVIQSISYSLPANIENAAITASGNGNLTGNALNNGLTGNAGKNILDGGIGNDKLDGGAGDDNLLGGVGNDDCLSGAGNDTMRGGEGVDLADFAAAGVNIHIDLSTGKALGQGTDLLFEIENILSGQGDDNLVGNAGANNIDGSSGDDSVAAGAGNDTLKGGNGNDTLLGADGNDLLVAGGGLVTTKISKYEIVKGGFTWAQAKADAEKRGGHLATVGSKQEWEKILAVLPNKNGLEGSAWLGASDQDKEGVWKWVDGTAWNFSNWFYGEPNNSGSEDYAIIKGRESGYAWNDWSASGESSYVLESAVFESNVLFGGAGNDTLQGSLGNDTMAGCFFGANGGRGERDTLVGGAGNDIFQLGWASGRFYDDGNTKNAGRGDYVLITDFTVGQDKLQLDGSASGYYLAASGVTGVTGTGLFAEQGATDELIAIIRSANSTALNVTNTVNTALFV
jgi:Ca2+-binding RTX toxin-like protein